MESVVETNIAGKPSLYFRNFYRRSNKTNVTTMFRKNDISMQTQWFSNYKMHDVKHTVYMICGILPAHSCHNVSKLKFQKVW